MTELQGEQIVTNETQGKLVNIVKNFENNIDELNDAIAMHYYEIMYERKKSIKKKGLEKSAKSLQIPQDKINLVEAFNAKIN